MGKGVPGAGRDPEGEGGAGGGPGGGAGPPVACPEPTSPDQGEPSWPPSQWMG